MPEPETAPAPKVIDGTERHYQAWLEDEAREREDKFSVHQREQIATLRQRRAGMTLLERHRATAEQAARLSTVGAAPLGRGRAGVDKPNGPPQQATFDFADADRFIKAGIELREQIIDEARGLGSLRNIKEMFAEQKDRMILDELVDWTPAEIEVFYRGALGSAETVRRLRRKNKLRGINGRPVEPRPESVQ